VRGLAAGLGAVALAPVAALVALAAILVDKAWPAIRYNGLGFLVRSEWHPGNLYANPVVTAGIRHSPGARYGALPLVVGTLEAAVVALLIALPLGLGAAVAVVRWMPRTVGAAVGFLLELLAGIPSVVLGLWGALVLGPTVAHLVAPLASAVPNVPVLRFLRGPVGAGEGLLTSGLVLALMVVPIVASSARELLASVPTTAVEGALALGMTEAEALRAVSFRWVRIGLVGVVVLAFGRAVGETMAVAMTSGVVLGTTAHNLYGAMTTIAATIVSQLDSAFTDASGLELATLAEAAVLLLAITLAANLLARVLVRQAAPVSLPVGRGL
jgi:phosphate transport system permease protein